MAKIVHVNCPRCGGTLGMAGVDRVVKCRYCGSWSLVDAPGVVPEYFVMPSLKESDARRVIQRLLMDDDMPDGMLKTAAFHSARLYFIPYHELSGKRLGTMTTTQYKETSRRPSLDLRTGAYGMEGVSLREQRAMTPKEKQKDTRVVMADVTRLEPAVRLSQWALDQAEISSLRSGPAGVLQPMNRRTMERLGKVYDATVSPEQMISSMDSGRLAASLDDRTEIAEVRIKRIFYPVWRVRYRYQGRLYGASVDGVTGKVMTARAPRDDRNRVLWLLGTSALLSFVGGKIVRAVGIAALFDRESVNALLTFFVQGAYLVAPLVLVALMVVVFVMGMGWEQFRYEGELIIEGDKRRVEKINRPARTAFDKIQKFLQDVINRVFQTYRQRRVNRW